MDRPKERPRLRRHRPLQRAPILFLTLLAAACGESATGPEGAGPNPPDPGTPDTVRAWTVPPEATGPGITPVRGDHVAMLGDGSRGELLVFFPGTGGRPDQYEEIVRVAAELGFHAISLSYVNTLSVNFSICNRHPGDQACHEAARLEILTGVESGYDPPHVDPANGAYHRLARLLETLHQAHPEDGWDQYLADGEPRWDRIAAAGHSQGGGHAALTAKLHPVRRALLFGATEPNAWTLEPLVMPPERLFALAHTLEQNATGILRSWANLGIPGTPASVDGNPAEWSEAQRLVTTRQDCVGDPGDRGLYHNCYIVDEYLPREEDGTPVFRAVWEHMLSATPTGPPPPAPGTAWQVSPEGASWLDPELLRLPEGAFMTLQDDQGRILLARLDEDRGTVVETHQAGTAGAPLVTTFNGPEFGLDAVGPSLWYTRVTGGGTQTARVSFSVDPGTGDVNIGAPETLTSGNSHFSPLATTDPDAPTTRFIHLRRPPDWGTPLWQDESSPVPEGELLHLVERPDGDARWVPGTQTFATNVHPEHPGRIVLVDAREGRVAPVGSRTDTASFPYGWRAPEAAGGLAVLALTSPEELTVWLPDGAGWRAAARLTAPAGAPPFLGSPEPFVAGGRSWISLTLADSEMVLPGRTRQQVWLLSMDGTRAIRCDDGRPGTVTRVDPEVVRLRERMVVYYYVMETTGSTVWACDPGIEA